jgi:ribose/xylose/arabinose/galactoside ABC-type transport system permease subunit
LSEVAANPLISIPLAIIAMLMIGLIVGTINGISITILKMPSFIATLATQLAFSGIAVLFTSMVTEKTAISGLPEPFFAFGGSGEFFIVPILIALVMWGFSYWLLKYTKFGNSIYAIGVNPRTAFISGINVKKVIFTLMILSGLFASVASVLATARNQVGLPSLGDKMFIGIMAAVIVGGTSTAGGFGGFKQTLLGVLFVTLITNALNIMGVQWFTVMIIQGALILVSTMAGTMFSKREKMRLMED